MKTLSVKLPEELDAQLAAMASRTKTSKSELARRALEAYVNGEQRPPKGSMADVAGHLIGCLEGPGDLSYNKNYMEDYGR